ncbi:MAG: hypothetical protein L6N94_05700 [Candidatus Methylarchaceae archaeon HK01M]|nr:hypothetical protein [Candidatus Methylarchaceae archaeon HK01M]
MEDDLGFSMIDKLVKMIEDKKLGLDPEVLAYWFKIIEADAKSLCPEDLRDSISMKQDPVLWMKFKVKLSRRTVPFLIQAIEKNLSLMPYATRLYFMKVGEIIEDEASRFYV